MKKIDRDFSSLFHTTPTGYIFASLYQENESTATSEAATQATHLESLVKGQKEPPAAGNGAQ